MKEFMAEAAVWPALALINVRDEDNMGDDRFLSALLFVILIVGIIALVIVIARVPEAWKIAALVFAAVYLLMGSAHAYATR